MEGVLVSRKLVPVVTITFPYPLPRCKKNACLCSADTLRTPLSIVSLLCCVRTRTAFEVPRMFFVESCQALLLTETVLFSPGNTFFRLNNTQTGLLRSGDTDAATVVGSKLSTAITAEGYSSPTGNTEAIPQ